jgi:acyl-coenzyme A synthetase/AMP-(fatty) acid ligase
MDTRGYGERVAYVGDDREPVTHIEVHERSARAAQALRGMGIGEGSRVALAARDSVSWVVAFLASARLGALVAIVSPDLREAAADQLYGHFQPELLLSDRDARGVPPRVLEDEAMGLEAGGPVPVRPDTPLYVQYTSGTTGTPKGAVHTHAHVQCYALAFGRGVLGLTPDDVCLSASRMFFAYGFVNSVIFPLASGARAVVSEVPPTPHKVAARCREHEVTVLFTVPSLYARLVSVADADAFEHVRVGVSGGERLQAATRAASSALLGAPILDCLGSTEMGYTYSANRLSDIVAGTVGYPLDGYQLELRENGEVLSDDEQEGDLWVRGPSMMQGYLDAPGPSADVLRDGWLWTKDRGRRVGGHYTVLGRVDDLETVNGVKVNPTEIEAILAACAGVGDVAVVGRADAEGLTRLYAYVVPATGGHPSLVETVAGAARAAFAVEPHKIPREVFVVDSLPRTQTGKLQRFALRNASEAQGL